MVDNKRVWLAAYCASLAGMRARHDGDGAARAARMDAAHAVRGFERLFGRETPHGREKPSGEEPTE